MYARRFYRRPARKYLRKRKAIGKRRTAVSSRIKKYVKKEIHRNIENKEKINYAANTQVQSGDAATCTYPMIIATAQGVDEFGRIGNQNRVVKGTYKICFNLLPYDATSNPNVQPTWVKVWVVKDLKNNGQLTTLDATAYANFFRGNGTGLPMQGTPLDTTLDVNKDYFRVLYSRMFKLGTASNLSGGYPSTANFADNSPVAKQLTINWAKWVKKQLKYNDSSTQCQNDNLYLVIQAVSADGSASNGKRLIEIHYTNSMHYEDA